MTQFEEILFGGGTGAEGCAGVVAVRFATGADGQRVVGVGYVDAAQRKMGVCEFPDNEIFSNLESLLVQISPKECLLAQGESSADGNKLREVCGAIFASLYVQKTSNRHKNVVSALILFLLSISRGVCCFCAGGAAWRHAGF